MGETMKFYCPPGIAGESVDGILCGSVTGMVNGLRDHRVTSAAGDDGSLTAWVDDEGTYRAAFSRWMVNRAEESFGSKAQLRAWLKKWWPAMRGGEVE